MECDNSCISCSSKEECRICNKGYYLSGSQCLENCLDGTYGDDNTQLCQLCSESCLSCYGPDSDQCLECNAEKGFSKINGECKLLACEDGSYLDINTRKCTKCHKSCSTCAGNSPNHCIECKSGYQPSIIDGLKTVRCKSCEEYMKGYYTTSSGLCKGIF